MRQALSITQGKDLEGFISNRLMPLLEINIIPACELVVGQLAAGLRAISEGVIADVRGKQVGPLPSVPSSQVPKMV